jgi:hypothetical protein
MDRHFIWTGTLHEQALYMNKHFTWTGTLHEHQYKFIIISRSVLLRMRNILHKSCTENQNTHFMFNNIFPLEIHAIYEIMWKNIVELGRSQTTI